MKKVSALAAITLSLIVTPNALAEWYWSQELIDVFVEEEKVFDLLVKKDVYYPEERDTADLNDFYVGPTRNGFLGPCWAYATTTGWKGYPSKEIKELCDQKMLRKIDRLTVVESIDLSRTVNNWLIFSALYKKSAALKGLDPSIIKDAWIDAFRRQICREVKKTTVSMTQYCPKLIGSQDRADNNSPKAEKNRSNKSMNEAHEICKDAKDYAGCMKFRTGSTSASEKRILATDKCKTLSNGASICRATVDGKDFLGMPKLLGWDYQEFRDEQMIIYERPDIHRVNVRGSSDRYIEKKKVNRRYSAGRRGIAPSTTTLSPSQTNCTSFAGAISCKTTPGQSIQSSGVSSIPPGVQQFTFSTILDCKDKTFAEYVTPPGSLNPYMLEKWKKAKPSSTEDLILKRSCPKIPALKLSSFTKLS